MSAGPALLQTIDPNTLETPTTRMRDAQDVQNFVRRLIDNDATRSYKRARLNGLVDGRPPYRASKLREQGRADACNVNWGRARSYLEAGAGSFYDLFSEAPGYFTIFTAYGTPEQQDTWNNIIAEEADNALRSSPVWDYEMQVSIDNMTLHGCGPLMFEDSFKCVPKAFLCGDLKVPEFAKSDTFYWEVGMIQGTYYPVELFNFIRQADHAKRCGWNVEHTRKVIANAMNIRTSEGIQYEWEFYQSELKNNACSYYDETLVCRLAHVFWKEFDGSITHAIVERDNASGLESEFLFLHTGRYKKFSEFIHPIYWDHGNGGYHHSVTGLGVKMYGAMELENRLLCNMADKAFAPKLIFKPTSTEATQRIQLAKIGEYGLLPKGADMVQYPMSGMINDNVEMYQVVKDVNSDVLSSYKQTGAPQTSGNPPTKFQKMYEASMMSALSKPQLSRYYKQLDLLYTEIYRRLSNLNSTCSIAQDFQAACIKRGVPKEAIVRIKKVQATRVVGQGSAFMRKVAIDSIYSVASQLPEEGRVNLTRDKIAAEAGQAAVSRYFPVKQRPMPTDQEVDAQTQVAVMKLGMATKISSSQNPVTYAAAFIGAASQAIASLQQGGNPHDVLRFLQLAGPAIAAHLRRIENDPTRKAIHQELERHLKLIAKSSDDLKKALAQAAQQQKTQAQKTGQVMNDAQLKTIKTMTDIKLKTDKQQAQMQQRAERHRFDMALADAETAHDLTLNRINALSE